MPGFEIRKREERLLRLGVVETRQRSISFLGESADADSRATWTTKECLFIHVNVDGEARAKISSRLLLIYEASSRACSYFSALSRGAKIARGFYEHFYERKS